MSPQRGQAFHRCQPVPAQSKQVLVPARPVPPQEPQRLIIARPGGVIWSVIMSIHFHFALYPEHARSV